MGVVFGFICVLDLLDFFFGYSSLFGFGRGISFFVFSFLEKGRFI